MKLSDLLNSLASNARTFEGQMEEWQKSMSAKGDDMMTKVEEWRAAAEQRSQEMSSQFKGFFDGADNDLKGQWDKMQQGFETQMTAARKQADEWRAEAEKRGAESVADWHEAYAANMVAVAKRAEEEASKAIAAAAEARAKAKSKKA